jgi:hypothetical protein
MTFSSGSNISQWRDKSGLSNNATGFNSPVLTTNSINGNQAIATNSTAYFIGPVSVTGTTLTVFCVAKITVLPNGQNDQRLVSLVNGNNVDYGRTDSTIALFNQGNTSTIALWRTSGPIANNAIVANTPFLAVSGYDGTNGYLWKDGSAGTLASNASSGTFAITKYGVGGGAYIGEFWSGSIGEVLIYTTFLTTSQRQQVEGYLSHKWGLTGYYNPTTPLSIPGCQLWLDAADPAGTGVIPSNGATVSTWVDKSGNGYNATAAPSRIAGTYSTSLRAVNFATSNTGYITNYSAAPTNETMFVVFNNPSPSQGNNILIGGVQGARSLGAGHTNPGGTGSVGNLNTQVAWLASTGAGTYTSGTTVVTTSQFTTSTNTISLNGGTAASGGAPGFTAGRVTYLGVDATNGGFYYIGYAMEILFYNSVLTTSQRQTIEGYLARKWGLTSMYGALPSIHPFYSIRPHLRGFQPNDIDGCLLWLDGADQSSLVLSGSNVTQWNDKSGNGKHATATGTPTYLTGGGINFNGSSYFLNQTFTMNLSQRSIFIVMQETIHVDARGVIIFIPTPSSGNDHTSSSGLSVETSSGLSFYNETTGGYSSGIGNSTLLVKAIYNDIMNVRTGSGYLNGTNATNVTAGYTAGTCSGYGVGGRWQSGSIANWSILNGIIYEIIVFNTALTTSLRQQVEGYLAHKWGLTLSYPANTPLSIPGCTMWLDGADPSGTGTPPSAGTLSTWVDKSGNGRNGVQYITFARPQFVTNSLNSRGGVSFSAASSNCYQTASALPIPGTIFVVGFSSNDGFILSGIPTPNSGHPPYYATFARSDVEFSVNNTSDTVHLANVASTSNVNYILTGLYTGSNVTAIMNGGTLSNTVAFSGTPKTPVTTLIGISSYGGGLSAPLGGTINEFITYSTALTTYQRQQVEGYLANKWGITISATLPSPHPFKSILPATAAHFYPTSITGCQLWLDGADQSSLVLSGSNVTTWRDKSGNGYHMNTVVGSTIWSGSPEYPTIGTSINGLQTVNFTPQAGLKQATTLDGVKNLFWVGRIAAPTGSGTGPNYFLLGHDSVYDWSANPYGDSFLYPPIVPSGINNASASLFTNDARAVTNTAFSNLYLPSAPNVSLLSVSGITGTTRYQGICYDRTTHIGWCGDLAEVLIFSTALTTSQRQQVEGYLAHKWGLTSSLPSKHPYRPLPPIFPPNLFIPTPSMYSALFNTATSTALSIPANSVLTLGTNNHTIEFWFYQTTRGQYDTIFNYGDTSAFTSTSNYYFNVGSSQFIVILGNGSGGFLILNGGTLVTLNAWHHYALVRNGSTFTLYIDGTSRGTLTSSISIGPPSGKIVIGGYSYTGSSDGFTGYITNFRFVNGTAVYTSNFTPPTTPLTAIPNTQILLQGLVDSGPNAFTVTNNGSVTLSTTVTPF